MINFEDFCYKSKIKNFDMVKENVLLEIDNMGKYSFVNTHQKISHTDWHLNKDFPRPYMQHLYQEFIRHSNELSNKFGLGEVELENFWFQQYEMGDFHSLHNHLCSFSNVAYIELPNKEISTSFVISGKRYTLSVEEGEILSFPGFIPHESPKNKGGRKTVVVLNTNTPLDYSSDY